jgi:hypothetical protein
MSIVGVVCCQVQVSATGRFLVQRSSTECGVSECDCKASIMKRFWPTMSCWAMGRGGEEGGQISGSLSGAAVVPKCSEMICRVSSVSDEFSTHSRHQLASNLGEQYQIL